MARTCLCALFFAISFLDVVISVDPPTIALIPAPDLDADAPPAPAPSLDAGAPSDSPFSSPPAPSPDLEAESPESSPAPSPDPFPIPVLPDVDADRINEEGENHPKRRGGGKKAGIAFGVIAAGGLVAGAGCVLKKRRDNERRAQYGYAMRRGFL